MIIRLWGHNMLLDYGDPAGPDDDDDNDVVYSLFANNVTFVKFLHINSYVCRG